MKKHMMPRMVLIAIFFLAISVPSIVSLSNASDSLGMAAAMATTVLMYLLLDVFHEVRTAKSC